MRKKNIWIMQTPDGKWGVKTEGASRFAKICDTQKDAYDLGREMAKKRNVELLTKGTDGKIRSKDSFGSDPRSIRDKEH